MTSADTRDTVLLRVPNFRGKLRESRDAIRGSFDNQRNGATVRDRMRVIAQRLLAVGPHE